jgi:Mrp family chromosome partitioning ATPase
MSDDQKPVMSQFDSGALLKTLKRTPVEARPTLVPTSVEVETDTAVFAAPTEVTVEPKTPVLAQALVSGSPLGEELRLLTARIKVLGEERPFRCMGIVSASGSEGKTTLAIGLAAALARQPGRRVLLVEGDLRRPAIEKYLGLIPEPGLAEWLALGNGPLPVRLVQPAGISILSGGRAKVPPELLGSQRMARLLEGARRFFHYVVVDCPPITPVADSVVMQDLLDGFLFVVRARRTPRQAVLRAISQLKPDRVRGLLFNDQREILTGHYGYRYSYKYGYGEEHDSSSSHP